MYTKDGGKKPSKLNDVKTLQMTVAGLVALVLYLFVFPRCPTSEVGYLVRNGGTQVSGQVRFGVVSAQGSDEDDEDDAGNMAADSEQVDVEMQAEKSEVTQELGYNDEIPAIDKSAQVFMGHKSTNTGWIVDTRCFKNKPLVGYGVGCGEDISWDVGMVTRYGFDMYLFDPTPKSIRYAKPIVRTHAKKMTFTPEGLAAKEGTLTFTKPQVSNHVSMRAGTHSNNPAKTIKLKVNTLKNWMAQFNHTYLDVFKIDIEGSEYEVLQQMIDEDWFPFTQLLVEYHQRWFDKGAQDPKHQRVLDGLAKAGFVPFAKRHGNQEISYIKVKDLRYCVHGDYERKTSS